MHGARGALRRRRSARFAVQRALTVSLSRFAQVWPPTSDPGKEGKGRRRVAAEQHGWEGKEKKHERLAARRIRLPRLASLVRIPTPSLSLPSNKKLDTEIQKIGIPMRSCAAPTTACNSQSSSAWIGRTSLRAYSVLSPGTYPGGDGVDARMAWGKERDKMRRPERCTCAAIKKTGSRR